MSRHPNFPSKPEDYFTNYPSYWISCSIDTKNKLSEFFTNHIHFKEDVVPIIINGTRPFSIYKYNKGSECLYMLLISKEGIHKICKWCNNSISNKDIMNKLYKYFYTYLHNEYFEELSIIKKMLPHIAQHYYWYKNSEIYNVDKNKGRYLCFLHHPNYILVNALSSFLTNISLVGDDTIMKSKIQIL